MISRSNLFRAACAAVLISAGLNGSFAADAARKPNIILLLTDDMGYGDPSCYSKGVGVPTPHIDSLAKDGTRFTQFYVAAPICSPSRTGIMTGTFPSRLCLNSYLQTKAGNRECEQADYLDCTRPTVAKAFKAAGYATAHIGKWHMGGGRDVTDAPSIGKYGFDEWVSTWESPDPYPALGKKYAPWDHKMEPGQVQRYDRTSFMVDKTLDFLRRNKNTPCYINLWPDDTHTPYWPNPEMQKKYGATADDDTSTPKKNYKGVLEEYDRQVGRLLDGLKELGIEKDTVVIFASDNGPAPSFQHARTGGLRGMKLSLYEGGIREPFIVRWPGHVPAGRVDKSSVLASVDLMPTLCKLAGVDLPSDTARAIDGEDLHAALLGKTTARTKPLFWEYGRKEKGYGYPGDAFDRSPNVAVRDGKWKLLVNADGTRRELYDIVADPNETTNLADKETSIVDDLSSRALAWRRSLPAAPAQ